MTITHGHTTKLKQFGSWSFDTCLCLWLINLIVLLYTHKSVSFHFSLHISFVCKNVTNLAIRILNSGTHTCLQKEKWVQQYSSYYNNYSWWNYLQRKTIYTTANVSRKKIMYTGWCRIGWMFYHRISQRHRCEIEIS